MIQGMAFTLWFSVCGLLSRVWLFATAWTIAHQAPLFTGFSRQEYWRGQPFPSPGDLPNPGIKPRFSTLQVDSLLSEPPGKPRTLEWVAYPYSRHHPDPGIKPGSPAFQADSLPAELPGNSILVLKAKILRLSTHFLPQSLPPTKKDWKEIAQNLINVIKSLITIKIFLTLF